MKCGFFALVTLLFFAVGVQAQNYEPGILPFQSYNSQGFDSVNLATGNLVVQIPLVSYPQKGTLPPVGIGLVYNSMAWQQSCSTDGEGDSSCILIPIASASVVPITLNALGIQDCFSCGPNGQVDTLTAVDSSGGSHAMDPLDYIPASTGDWLTSDATAYRFDHVRGIVDRNGIQEGCYSSQSSCYRQDPSGNKVVINVSNGYFGAFSGFTDSFNRNIPVPQGCYIEGCTAGTYSAGCFTYQYWVPGNTGTTAPYTFCYSSHTFSSSTGGFSDPPACTVSDGSSTVIALDSVTLPNNSAWTFTYDSSGDLIAVKTPTGGEVDYGWQSQESPPTDCNSGEVFFRTVTSRTVKPSLSDPSQDGTWTYTYNNPGTKVLDPDGGYSIHQFTGSVYETQVQSYDSNSNLLETVNKTYDSSIFPTVPELTTTTWLPSNQTSGTCTIYDDNQNTTCAPGQDALYANGPIFDWADYGYPSLQIPIIYGSQLYAYEYGYGTNGSVGSRKRETINQFKWLTDTSNTYKDANLINLISSTQIKDGAGNQSGYTAYGYDESFSNNSCPNGPCGNQTSVQQWSSVGTTATSSCPVATSPNGYAITYKTYNSDGTLATVADPCAGNPTGPGHVTGYAYSPGCYAGTGPTSITNAAGQTTSYCYDIDTGVQTSVTDPNLQTTHYQYDNMREPTEIDYPDGGLTHYSYTPSSNEVTVCEYISPTSYNTSACTGATGTWENGNVIVDGLSRLSQTQLSSDPDGATYALTQYDKMGRKATVYNPTRCSAITTNCGESTWGITGYSYDALSRLTKITEQDGGTVTYNYTNFPCVTITDEANKSRQECSDGLGRLTSVVEDPGGLNYATSYGYDALDNLISVNQSGLQRSFMHDSLSRLTSAVNPESGTESYTYDADGDLIYKTMPAQNQQGSATVMLTYCYDGLNRMTAKAYSQQSCSNPTLPTFAATYSYDQVGCQGASSCYNVGRRTGMNDQAGSEAWAYDSMGRAIVDTRTTVDLSTATPQTQAFTNAYNFDGSLASIVYPTPSWASPETISYTVGGAGRPIDLASNGNTGYLNNVHYEPSGKLCTLTTGWGAAMDDHLAYNSRLQPTEFQYWSAPNDPNVNVCATGTPGGYQDFYDYLYYYADVNGHNNGNVAAIQNGMNPARTQYFTYDSVNRISTAETLDYNQPRFQGDNNFAYCWGEAYNYDTWGNLLSIGVASSAYTGCTQENLNQSFDGQNHIVGDTYDAAGNLISIPSVANYTYDAENHLISAGGVNYSYDGDGRRVSKSSGVDYFYDGNDSPLVENDPNATTIHRNYMFNGQRILSREGPNENWWVDQFYTDAIGNVRADYSYEAWATGEYDDIDYYPFGGERDYNADGNQYKFTGKQRDPESCATGVCLDDFEARYYASQAGRFLSPDPGNAGADPTNPQSWNMYSYVMNNPLTNVDPTGLDCVYLNNSGTGVESVDPDSDTNIGECQSNGGKWADGTFIQGWYDTSSNNVYLQTQNRNGDIGMTEAGIGDDGRPYSTDTQWGPGANSPQAADEDQQYAAAVLGQVFHDLRSIDPDMCGGGYFVFPRGKEFDIGVVHSGAYVMVNQDGREGNSAGLLVEAGVGPISGGHEGYVNTSTGKTGSTNYVFGGFGDHVGAFAGYSGRNSPIEVGGYASAFARGGGGYVNLVPAGGCHN